MENNCPRKLISILKLSGIWIFLVSSLLHFGYSFTHFYPLSFICAVNESVWEHVKIIFFAALFVNLFLYFRYFNGNDSFVAGLAPALLSITLTVPFLFYGYTGIIGFHLLILDLIITFASSYIAQMILLYFACGKKDYTTYKGISILIIIIMILLFFVFTWYPPSLPLFMEALGGNTPFFVSQ